jgi:hypothetical protein
VQQNLQHGSLKELPSEPLNESRNASTLDKKTAFPQSF